MAHGMRLEEKFPELSTCMLLVADGMNVTMNEFLEFKAFERMVRGEKKIVV